MAISVFYAFGTLIGGVGAPALFGALIESRSQINLFWGYLAAALLMLFAAGFELFAGVAAEGRSLEQISAPLSAATPDKSPAATSGAA